MHVVNFSSHLSKQRPFNQLYEMLYVEFGKRRKYSINGLCVSDMLKMLESAGLRFPAVPSGIRPDALPAVIDSGWKDRYKQEELALRKAVQTTL